MATKTQSTNQLDHTNIRLQLPMRTSSNIRQPSVAKNNGLPPQTKSQASRLPLDPTCQKGTGACHGRTPKIHTENIPKLQTLILGPTQRPSATKAPTMGPLDTNPGRKNPDIWTNILPLSEGVRCVTRIPGRESGERIHQTFDFASWTPNTLRQEEGNKQTPPL